MAHLKERSKIIDLLHKLDKAQRVENASKAILDHAYHLESRVLKLSAEYADLMDLPIDTEVISVAGLTVVQREAEPGEDPNPSGGTKLLEII